MAQPAPNWTSFTDTGICQFCRQHQLDVDISNANLKQDIIDWLDAHHITPAALFATTFLVNLPAAAEPPRVVKLDIKQQPQESLVEFLRRFECAAELHHIPAEDQVGLLQLNLLPHYSQHITDFDAPTQAS